MEMVCSRPISRSGLLAKGETRLAACSSPVFVGRRHSGGWARTPVAPSLHRNRGDLRFSRSGLKGDVMEPGLEFVQGKFTLQSMAFLAVADLSVEGG